MNTPQEDQTSPSLDLQGPKSLEAEISSGPNYIDEDGSHLQATGRPSLADVARKTGRSRPNRKTKKNSQSSEPVKAYANGCPMPGTNEARDRTLWASISRCKDWKAILDCLAKRNCTEEDLWRCAEEKRRTIPAARKSKASGGDQYLRLTKLKTSYEAARYFDLPRAHFFFIICRQRGLENDFEASDIGDYICLVAFHVNISGNAALHSLLCLLEMTARDQQMLRHCLRNGDRKTVEGFCSCIFPTGIPFDGYTFREFGMSPVYIMDITDPSSPKYCHLSFTNNFFRTIPHPPVDFGPEMKYQRIPLNQTVFSASHGLSHYRLVKPHAVRSVWPSLPPAVLPPPPFWPVEVSTAIDSLVCGAYLFPWTMDVPPQFEKWMHLEYCPLLMEGRECPKYFRYVDEIDNGATDSDA